jgi:hypothetical protein
MLILAVRPLVQEFVARVFNCQLRSVERTLHSLSLAFSLGFSLGFSLADCLRRPAM